MSVIMNDEDSRPESTYNPLLVTDDVMLRMSKSSFMSYRQCPRKFWWRRIGLPDIEMPDNEAALKGRIIHQNMEDALTSFDPSIKDVSALYPVGGDYDETVMALADLEQQRLEAWGPEFFAPLVAEQKTWVVDEENNVCLVGAFDGLFRHPSGGLCIAELKTGNLSTGKLSRVRRELAFYAYMLELMGNEPVTHFMVISSDCINDRTASSMLASSRKETFLGRNPEMGITIVEKVNRRTMNAFQKDYRNVLEGIRSLQWQPDWDDFFCQNYCDFFMSCDNQLHGDGSDPTA